MATIDTGSGHAKRSVNSELPLVPFIDFLLCLVAFLLVTAVWSQMARLESTAEVPGEVSTPTEPLKRLHVRMKNDSFELVWKQGETVLATSQVPRRAEKRADGSVRYPELAERLAAEWNAHGDHRATSDRKQDLAVLHATNAEPFGELAAVMDAVHSPTRALGSESVAAFNVSFAAN
ncbi:MAG: biopolymer transporter ExbD [Polyangiaceae bacterium]